LRSQAFISLVAVITLVILAGFAVVLSDVALGNANAQADRDRQIQLDSASFVTGMLNEETGVRGYTNTAQTPFLDPYTLGHTQVLQSASRLDSEVSPEMRTLLSGEENAAAAWQTWAKHRIAAVSATGAPSIDAAESALGKQLFDAFRFAAMSLDAQVASTLAAAQVQALSRSTSVLVASIASAVLIVALLVLLAVVTNRSTLRPLGRLLETASLLAAGEPAEITDVRSDNEVGRLAQALAAWKRTEIERLAVIKTATELNSLVDRDEIVELGARRLREVLDCPYVTISLADPLGLRIILTPGVEPKSTRVSAIESPSAQAFRSGRTVITDLRTGGWDETVVVWRDEHAAGPALAVPLVSTGEILGVVTCVRRSDQPAFSQTDRDRAELVAPSLASAIRVSLLFERARDSAAMNDLLETRVLERTSELESFSYSVSHDLRTPLRALSGFVDVLVEEIPEQLNGDAQDALLEIRSNAVRMGHLIDDLLAFSRLGNKDLQKRDVDMTGLARQSIDDLAVLTQGRSIELEIQQVPRCMGDAGLLAVVWTNLLANAIKFTGGRAPARITAGAEERDGRDVYFVRDNGVGFDMAHTANLFGVFQRLHATNEFEGTGIGLATVKRICIRHGGTAWAEAVLGQGATLYFTVGADKRRSTMQLAVTAA
jgi:signal transduction histidine kinase/CHASE3 domain sensor protein